MSLSVRQLEKVYQSRRGRVQALTPTSFEVGQNEFVSLVGPSGCGKSTLLNILGLLDTPTDGRYTLNGQAVANLDFAARARIRNKEIGFIFQSFNLIGDLTVFENVELPLTYRGMNAADRKAAAVQALERVGMGHRMKHYPSQLSGGQQQRVAIARAIVFEPSVVLMDEPLGALDKNLRYEMQTEIKEIQKQLGMTVVYVTHDQEEAMNMSDRIAIMNAGRIVQAGSPRDVYERPADRFAGRFLGEANLIPGAVTLAAGEGQSVLTLADGRTLRAVAMEALTAGAGATLFIRPEQIELAATQNSADPDINQLSGRIESLSFLGNTLRYMVRVADDLLVMAERPNNGRDAIFAAGAAVTLRWRAAQSLLLMR